jgi:hypothetical protein
VITTVYYMFSLDNSPDGIQLMHKLAHFTALGWTTVPDSPSQLERQFEGYHNFTFCPQKTTPNAATTAARQPNQKYARPPAP